MPTIRCNIGVLSWGQIFDNGDGTFTMFDCIVRKTFAKFKVNDKISRVDVHNASCRIVIDGESYSTDIPPLTVDP